MSRPRKYEAGAVLTFSQAAAEIRDGNYIMWHDKPIHPGWARGWQLGMLFAACARGIIKRAKITRAWKEQNK